MKKVISTVLFYIEYILGVGKQLWLISTQTHISLIWIFTGVVLSSREATSACTKERTKRVSPPHRGASDFWPYLGLLLWLSYPWSYLKEDEIWQVLGLAKAASWLHSGLPVGNPSQNLVSTFKSVWFLAVLCTSALTCRASLALRQVELDICFLLAWRNLSLTTSQHDSPLFTRGRLVTKCLILTIGSGIVMWLILANKEQSWRSERGMKDFFSALFIM